MKLSRKQMLVAVSFALFLGMALLAWPQAVPAFGGASGVAWLALAEHPADAQSAQYAHHGNYALPARSVTPGAVNAVLFADPSGKPHYVHGLEANLCAKDFRTGPYRHTSESTKKAACAEYGAKACPGPNWEIDHLISLEIGGADELANLWPQPILQARLKDHGTEDQLPKLVCAGRISLKDAQKCIAGDWVTCAAKIRELEQK